MMNESAMLGKIIFISGPSGVGKGTVIQMLRERHPEFVFPPSCTTRQPRPGEIDGVTYYFISPESFENRIESGEFLEYAQVHGNHMYGTLKTPLVEAVESGKTAIREFDVQGYLQAIERLPRVYYTSIFLVPAEDEVDLVRRIRERAPITDDEVAQRVESMRREIEQNKHYDHQVISYAGEQERLYEDVLAVIRSICHP